MPSSPPDNLIRRCQKRSSKANNRTWYLKNSKAITQVRRGCRGPPLFAAQRRLARSVLGVDYFEEVYEVW